MLHYSLLGEGHGKCGLKVGALMLFLCKHIVHKGNILESGFLKQKLKNLGSRKRFQKKKELTP